MKNYQRSDKKFIIKFIQWNSINQFDYYQFIDKISVYQFTTFKYYKSQQKTIHSQSRYEQDLNKFQFFKYFIPQTADSLLFVNQKELLKHSRISKMINYLNTYEFEKLKNLRLININMNNCQFISNINSPSLQSLQICESELINLNALSKTNFSKLKQLTIEGNWIMNRNKITRMKYVIVRNQHDIFTSTKMNINSKIMTKINNKEDPYQLKLQIRYKNEIINDMIYQIKQDEPIIQKEPEFLFDNNKQNQSIRHNKINKFNRLTNSRSMKNAYSQFNRNRIYK